uniref:NAC transcription factor 010 n=1 Tax=Rhizophora mucronata TaxID=61149 RepID=A0A2P2NG55_RHIMU
MKIFNFVRDGMIRLSPGFRFQPTDEELVFQYLRRKVLSLPLPANIIPEINVCKYDPWDLPGNLEQERYFFSYTEAKYRNGNRINRATASGYWKATGIDKKIVSSSRNINDLVGMKKTLVFHRGKPPNGSRTDWVMHEYRLVSIGPIAGNFSRANDSSSTQNSFGTPGNRVLCRIFSKQRSSTKTDYSITRNCEDNKFNILLCRPTFFNFLGRDKVSVSSSSSSSSSSIITDPTEVSSSGEDHEESSSCS